MKLENDDDDATSKLATPAINNSTLFIFLHYILNIIINNNHSIECPQMPNNQKSYLNSATHGN